jgi:CDP-diacylglycerol--glycerol-3-phosphate 3-phosphatidyltransferase
MSLPNLLTFARIAAIPVLVLLLLEGSDGMRWAAFTLFIAAAITDYFDGFLARRWNIISPLGRMLDPIADKLIVCAVFVTLAYDGTLSAYDLMPVLIILLREILVAGLREFLAGETTVHVSRLAKFKTTFQLAAIAILIAEPLVPGLTLLGTTMLWLAALLTLLTGFDYFRKSWSHFDGPEE